MGQRPSEKLSVLLVIKDTVRLNIVITQIITLIGVFLGAAASYFATAATERARHKRTMETRWDERKLSVYADYASAVKRVNRVARIVSTARGEPKKFAALLAEMDEAETVRSILFETFILLADPSALKVANAVNLKLWQILRIVRNPATSDDIQRERLASELMSELTDLHQWARLDLGIKGKIAP